jgi:hypothetical protein
MTQRLTDGIQHKILMKLLEFNYSIEYKRGAENRVADALSRREHNIAAIFSAIPAWTTEIEQSYTNDKQYTKLI